MRTEWVERYQAAWNSHEAGQVVAFMAEDVVYDDVANGGRYDGRDAAQAYVESVHQWSNDYRFLVVTAQSSGDDYAFEWEMLGTDTGGLGGVPPTGARYRIRGVFIGRLNADRHISVNRDYGNPVAP